MPKERLDEITMRLLLIEDHTMLRQATSDALRREFPNGCIDEADSEYEARLKLSAEWDVIVLDLGLPDGGGFGLITHIKSRAPKARIVVLTAASESHALAALEAGAEAYLTKKASLAELSLAISKVMNGSRYFSQYVMKRALDLVARKGSTTRLSPRELDVLRLTSDGMSCIQIADIIHVSPKTVETYRRRLNAKLGTRGIAGLVRYAFESEYLHRSAGA